jgi:uncharacterized protein YndB with AHSA1/START domain
MLKKILLAAAALLAVVLIAAALQAPAFKVERTITIAAAPRVVFDYVNDFHRWAVWSPWEKLDPQMTRSFSGPAAGPGSVYGWSGNSDVGVGRMTISESRPGEAVRIKLEFLKPFEASNDTLFAFRNESGRTVVTWTMSGEKNYLSKLMCMFVSMDAMVGGDFEQGLANLKAAAESGKAG